MLRLSDSETPDHDHRQLRELLFARGKLQDNHSRLDILFLAATTLSATTASRRSKMISDDDLYRLAIFLGSAAMVLIVLYSYLEVNANEVPEKQPLAPQPAGKQASSHK